MKIKWDFIHRPVNIFIHICVDLYVYIYVYTYVKYFNSAKSQQILVAHTSHQWEYNE